MIKRYINAFLTKFFLFAPVIGIILPYFSKADSTISIIAAILAALATFLTADLVIYPRYGNLTAVLMDAVITVLVLLEIAYITETGYNPVGLVLIAALIASGEWYYHKYLQRMFFSRRRR